MDKHLACCDLEPLPHQRGRKPTCPISIIIMNWNEGSVDWKLLEIGPAISVQLRIEI